MNLNTFFNPKRVAVIGASGDKSKVGYSATSNLISSKGVTVYPVTLKDKEVLGVPAFASVLDIPGEIDLAVIAVRADIVPQIIEECGKKKIPAAIIISAGFREMNAPGKELEERVAAIAKQYDVAILGPNCLGTMNAGNDFNASFSAEKPLPGNIALLSQSGALGTAMLDWAIGEGVGFSKFISLGNEAQLTEIDFLKFLADDSETNSILVYLEKVSDGPEFMRLVSSITPNKTVVVLKAGVSSRGVQAVMSHTGSLAPESSVFAAACKQAGAVMVGSLQEFFNIAKLLSQGVTISMPTERLVILTNGGGPSVVATDLVDESHSLSLVELDENTKDALRKVLPPMAAVDNPIDIIGDALAARYESALDILCGVNDVDGIMVMLTPQMMTETENTARLLLKYKDKKKIFPVFIGGPSIQSGRAALIESGLVHFGFPRDVIGALDALAGGKPKFESQKINDVPSAPSAGTSLPMTFADISRLFKSYGIILNGIFVTRKEDLTDAIRACGNGPYAMKAFSAVVIHKTDKGAIKLNISNVAEAFAAWESIDNKITGNNPDAKIEGMLVQPMAFGKEVIIGMKRDVVFGPVILFGLGGIFAEALKDTTLRIAPISKEEALRMMQEIKGIKILRGMRGEKPVNFDALADILVNFSRLVLEHPEIKEIDLNPVIVTDTAATVVDARVMI